MNRPTEPTFDQRIADWLEEDPNHAPQEVLGTVLAAYPSIPQRHASRMPWRLPTMFNNRALLGAAAAVLVVTLAGGTYLVLRDQNASAGASPSPGARSSASPLASGADPIAAYRAARNQVCLKARQAFTEADLSGWYDPSLPPDARAAVNAEHRKQTAAVKTAALELAAIQPPPELAAEHWMDVAREQDLAALHQLADDVFATGDVAKGAALDPSVSVVGDQRVVFEQKYNLFACV
jgi:hypothetical protein